MTNPLHAGIRRWVLSAFPRDPVQPVEYDAPAGDPGLFGPDSVTWKIHADFPGMLAGGLSALMLQCLHPLALAGVWDHSDFRRDLIGRLRRTTQFVAGTSYAGHDEAQRLIERVRRIHKKVRGQSADGRAYSADDPALLTWVHVTEAWSFLAGYCRYCRADLPADAADRYFDETRRVAEALGARDVPDSEAAVLAYLQRIRPELHCDQRSREVLGILERIRLPVPFAGLSRRLFLGAAIALLPTWAADQLGYGRFDRLRAGMAAGSLAALAPLIRGALGDGIAVRACHRVGADPAVLSRW